MSAAITPALGLVGLLEALAAGPLEITHVHSSGGGPLMAADWLLAIGALAAAHYLYHAVDAIDIERVTLQREIDALDAFIARVESLAERTAAGSTSAQGSTLAAQPASAGPSLSSLRECYRETVMAVDHYDEAYGESLATHVERELGPQYAAVLAGSGSVSAPLLQGLVVQATQAKQEREAVLDALDTEESSVERARAVFADVEERLSAAGPPATNGESFEGLRRRWDELGAAKETCERALARRQETIQELTCRRRAEGEPMFIQEFLYDSLDARFPVLERGTELVGQLESSRAHLIDGLTTRS